MNIRVMSRICCAAGAVLAGWQLQAAEVVAGDAQLDVLDLVVVKGQALERAASTVSVTTLDQSRVREERVTQMEDLFREIAGMNVLNYGLPGVGNAIVLRGFGGGGHGGDLGTAIDGIPLNEAMSHADGYVDFGVIVPLEIEGMSVTKGPASPLYGNFNRSGMVGVSTRKSGDYAEADFSADNDSSVDLQMAMGAPLHGSQQVNLAGQYFRSHGFRPQSGNYRATVAGRWGGKPTDAVDVSVSARLHRANSDSASYLTLDQFRSDPHGIDPNVQNDGAEKHFGTLRVDTTYRASDSLKLVGFAYGTRQDFTRWFTRPVSVATWRQREESYDRGVLGFGASLNGVVRRGTLPITWVAGAESNRESTDYEFYDGLDRRARVSPAINDRNARLNSASAFGQIDMPLHRLVDASFGARYDRFTGRCRLRGPETSTSACGDLNVMDNLSPKLGVRFQPLAALGLRASWSEGFALPGGFVKYAAAASELKPNLFRQTEIGLTLRPVRALSVDLAAFRIESSQEVRQLITGQYENYGRTRRAGLEAEMQWQAAARLRFSASWALTDSEVRENGNAALIGNRVAGVSRHMGTVNAHWALLPRLEVNTTVRYVGGYAIDAANSADSDQYTTVDLGGSYLLQRGGHVYRLFVSVENLADKVHAASWSRIGGVTTLAPGQPRLVRAGVQFDL